LAGKEGVTVTLKTGQVIHGIARNRSNYSLQIVDDSGKLWLLSMSDVKDLKINEHSIMPTDYATRLTSDELRDLVAYVAHQSLRPRGAFEESAQNDK
jgi:putative heme-binding domain-containing protein